MAVGLAIPLQVAVTAPPAATVVGLTLSDAGGGGAGASAASAWLRRMRGFAIPLRLSVIDRPVDCSAFRMVATDAPGLACFNTAHAPVTCGVAIEVPRAPTKLPPG